MFTPEKNRITRNVFKPTLLLLLTSGFLIGCDKDDDAADAPINESELITTVTLIMQEAGTTNVVTATFRDSDGEGGNAPTKFDEIVLKPNTVYNTTIALLDESKTPPAYITEEIEEEDEDHQFFYTPTTGLNVTVAYDDADDNNLPVGLKTKVTTGAASTGSLKVTLKHQPGIKNNNQATGDTDVELNFNTKVQ